MQHMQALSQISVQHSCVLSLAENTQLDHSFIAKTLLHDVAKLYSLRKQLSHMSFVTKQRSTFLQDRQSLP